MKNTGKYLKTFKLSAIAPAAKPVVRKEPIACMGEIAQRDPGRRGISGLSPRRAHRSTGGLEQLMQLDNAVLALVRDRFRWRRMITSR